jgi:hypothetical protein
LMLGFGAKKHHIFLDASKVSDAVILWWIRVRRDDYLKPATVSSWWSFKLIDASSFLCEKKVLALCILYLNKTQ